MSDTIDIQKIRELNAFSVVHLRKRLKELNNNTDRHEYLTVCTCIQINDSNSTFIEIKFPSGFHPLRFPTPLKLGAIPQDEWKDCVIKHIDQFYGWELNLRKVRQQNVDDREYKEYQRLKSKFDKND